MSKYRKILCEIMNFYDWKMEEIKMYTHSEINSEIQFLAKSEIRMKILSELYNHPDNIRGLVKKTKITYSSVSSNINKLEENNYIKKVDKKYFINPMAKMYFNNLMEFKKSIDIINDFNSFWDKHNLNQLGIDSMKNIADLKNSTLIETTPLDIYRTHNTIKSQLVDSKEVKAIFPYLHPEYPKLIEEILKKGGSVELIVPKNILNPIITPIDGKLRKNSQISKKLKVHPVKNELNLYLTLCDGKMSLGLFKNDGSFDQNRILISGDSKSYNWANELFKHVKQMVRT